MLPPIDQNALEIDLWRFTSSTSEKTRNLEVLYSSNSLFGVALNISGNRVILSLVLNSLDLISSRAANSSASPLQVSST